MLAPLGPHDRTRLRAAMATVEALLSDAPREPPALVLRRHQPGDIGWIIHRQGRLYAEEYGWDETYEGLVAEILAGFVKNFDPRRERAWIAEMDGGIVGSVFLVRQDDAVAKLRLLYVEPAARGLGIGGRLVEEVIAFARLKGYRTLTLWTNDILAAARRIYEAAGFRLVVAGPPQELRQGPRRPDLGADALAFRDRGRPCGRPLSGSRAVVGHHTSTVTPRLW